MSCAALYEVFIEQPTNHRYDRFELKLADTVTVGDDGAVVRTGNTHWTCNASVKSGVGETSTRKWTHISAVSSSDVRATKSLIYQTIAKPGKYNVVHEYYLWYKVMMSNHLTASS